MTPAGTAAATGAGAVNFGVNSAAPTLNLNSLAFGFSVSGFFSGAAAGVEVAAAVFLAVFLLAEASSLFAFASFGALAEGSLAFEDEPAPLLFFSGDDVVAGAAGVAAGLDSAFVSAPFAWVEGAAFFGDEVAAAGVAAVAGFFCSGLAGAAVRPITASLNESGFGAADVEAGAATAEAGAALVVLAGALGCCFG